MATKTQRPRAFSYLRFSTPEQLTGDSQRRQIELARAYAEKHGLELDEKLSFADLGVSAFRGANTSTSRKKKGELGQFLEAVKCGEVPKGSFLLVEHLDRLSRQTARKALRVLEDIIEAGVTVVTLLDGERRYTRASLNGLELMYALLPMIASHEESAKKAVRIKKVYLEKVAKARRGEPVRVNAKHPGWLKHDAATGRMVGIPERVAVVKRIFKLTLQGVGRESIARKLNAEKVPMFGRGARWYASYVGKIRASRAVLGEFHASERVTNDEGEQTTNALPVIKGYYPQIISKRDFEQVQTLAMTATPQRGRHVHNAVSNVLGGLAECPLCGGTMTRTNKGKKGLPYLVCTKAKEGAGCSYRSVLYSQVEDVLFANVVPLVEGAPEDTAKSRKAEAQMATNEREQEALTDALENLSRLAESSKGSTPATVISRMQAIETELARLRAEQQTLRASGADASPTVVKHRLKELEKALQEPRDLGLANTALRAALKGVVVDYRTGCLVFKWHQGGESEVVFAFPDEGGNTGRRKARKVSAGN